jgi:hypothetical protein
LEIRRQNEDSSDSDEDDDIARPKLDHATIADEMNVSIQTVKNYSINLNNFGSILPPAMIRKGHPYSLTRSMIDVTHSFNEIDIRHCEFSLKTIPLCIVMK